VERVLSGSSLAGHGAAKPELRLLPKGLLLRGTGGPSTRLSVRTQQGAVDVSPMARIGGT
jgi:hypothetical protein